MPLADVSERTLRLLGHERMKTQFFAKMSHEIQFEYVETPEMLMLSEWGAQSLGLPESIANPRESSFGTEVFTPEDFAALLERLKETTPKEPVMEETYLLNIGGQKRWSKVITRSMWTDGEPAEYEGAIG